MGDGALRAAASQTGFREAEEEGVVWEGSGNEGKQYLRPPPLLCEPFQCEGSVCILSESLRMKAGKKARQKIQGRCTLCRALFLLSSQMECLLKKPISLVTVQREQAGSAADSCISNSASA